MLGSIRLQPAHAALCGAFTLTGEPVAACLPPAVLERMRSGLRASDIVEHAEGCAWVACSRENLFHTTAGTLVVGGFILPGEDAARLAERLCSIVKGSPCGALADGHYTLVLVRPDRALIAYRDPAGGERLCYLVAGNVLAFASSVRLLLASGLRSTSIDVEAVKEAMLSRCCSTIFGNMTLFDGVSELHASQALVAEKGCVSLHWLPNPVLRPPVRGLPSADALRSTLDQSMEKALAGRKKVAVSLSGGFDSSTLAALAVKLLGAGNVEAFTWEYGEPHAPSDVPYAAQVAHKLGIRHHVVRVSFEEYLDALVELIWRVEAPRIRSGSRILLARAARQRGFDCLLDGAGLEGLIGGQEPFPYFARVGALEHFRGLEWLVRGWKWWSHRRGVQWLLNDVLRAPPSQGFYLTVCVLLHNTRIRDAGSAYGGSIGSFVKTMSESRRVAEAVAAHRHKPLCEQLLHFHYHSYRLQSLLGGQRMAYAEAGAVPLSPCLFPTILESVNVWPLSGGRRVHRQAIGDALPPSVLERPKIEYQAVAPRRWRRCIGAIVLPALAPSLLDSLDVHGDVRSYLSHHFHAELSLLALWRAIAVDRSSTRPPTWNDLGLARVASATNRSGI